MTRTRPGPEAGTLVIEVTDDDGPLPIVVRGLSRTEWPALIDQHPSVHPALRWAPSLESALVHACLLAPPLDLDDVERLVDDPDIGGPLVEACLQLTLPGSWEWARVRLERDDRLRREVAAAVHLGVPHSKFTGWAERDQDLVLAHLDLEQDRCPGCGAPAVDMYDHTAWEPAVRACFHCMALAGVRGDIPDEARAHTHVYLRRPEQQHEQQHDHPAGAVG